MRESEEKEEGENGCAYQKNGVLTFLSHAVLLSTYLDHFFRSVEDVGDDAVGFEVDITKRRVRNERGPRGLHSDLPREKEKNNEKEKKRWREG